MSKFIITINTDNAAFHTEGDENTYAPEQELARILESIAGQLVHDISPDPRIIDYNGKQVGEIVHEVDEEDSRGFAGN